MLETTGTRQYTHIRPIMSTVIGHGLLHSKRVLQFVRPQDIARKKETTERFSHLLVVAQVSLMDDNGNNRDDLTLPKGTSDAETLAKQLKDDFDNGKELVVTVLKVFT